MPIDDCRWVIAEGRLAPAPISPALEFLHFVAPSAPTGRDSKAQAEGLGQLFKVNF
jgi:hypothetical protein